MDKLDTEGGNSTDVPSAAAHKALKDGLLVGAEVWLQKSYVATSSFTLVVRVKLCFLPRRSGNPVGGTWCECLGGRARLKVRDVVEDTDRPRGVAGASSK